VELNIRERRITKLKKSLLALAVMIALCGNVFAVESKATGTAPVVKKEQKKSKKKVSKTAVASKTTSTK
jgi:hypothetical protein